MKEFVFDFADYRSYLVHRFGGVRRRTGLRSQAAQAMGCHSTFLSHVLQEKADLSLEQADRLNDFLGHSASEAHFFLLLLQKDRAGTTRLRKYFQRQMHELLHARTVIANRVPENKALSKEDEATYYSSWLYGAAHVSLTIPALQSREALARYLEIPPTKAAEIVDFLLARGLAKQEGVRLKMGDAHVHLAGSSENITKHHTNWRMQAIRALDLKRPEDLHYSAVVTLSRDDAALIRDRLLTALRENLETIQKSPEEEAYVYGFDFFPLRRSG